MSSPPEGPSSPHGPPAGWHADPLGRFELRYHNGTTWTADVSTSGDRFVDPLGTTAGPSPPEGTAPSGRATAAMVLGIVAIGIGWFPYVAVAGAVCGVLAIALGIAARRRAGTPGSPTAGRARVGIVTGAVGLGVAALGLVFTVVVTRALDRYTNPEPNEAVITSCTTEEGRVTAAGELTNLGSAGAGFTVRVAILRPGTDNVHRTASVELDDVGPGATERFDLTAEVALDDVECEVLEVDGPLPFGLDIAT